MDRIDKTLFEPTKWLDGVSCMFRKMMFDSIKYIIKTLVSHINRFVQHLASQTPVSFTVTGYMRQTGDSNYDQQYPLLCNNGELTWVDSELPVGYKRLKGLHLRSARFVLENFYLTGNDTLSFRFKGAAGNVIGCFNNSSSDDNYSFYCGSTSTAKYARYNGQVGGSSVTNASTWYSVVMSPTGVTGINNPSEFTPSEFTCPVPFCIGATSPIGSVHSNLYLEGNITVSDRLKLIPVERISDSELGWFDGETLYLPTEGTVESLGYDYSHITLVGVGTKQMLHVDSATYTFPDLFRSATSYVLDKVDIVGDRAIFTKSSSVFKMVDDGEWTVYNPATSPTVWFQHTLPNFKNQGGTGTPKCRANDFTVVSYNTGISAEEYGAYAYVTNDGVLRVQARDSNMTLADFLTLLTQRENNGSPSYVIYATTVETVTEYTVDPLILGTSSTNLGFEPRQTSSIYTLEFTLVYKATQ